MKEHLGVGVACGGISLMCSKMMLRWRCLLLLVLLQLVPTARAEKRRQALAQVSSSLTVEDLSEEESCGGGEACRREVVSARAVVLGHPLDGDDCALVDGSVGDGFTLDDMEGATLGVVHSCTNSEGMVLPQVRGW